MKTITRIISLLMVALMLTTSVPFMPVRALDDGTEEYTLTIENTYSDSSLAENSSVGGMSFFGSAEFDGCYGNQLSGVAREIYDSLVKKYVTDKTTGEYAYTFETPFTFDAEISGNGIVTNDELESVELEIQYAVQAAMDAFLYDHPEIFWLKKLSTSYGISASGNSIDGFIGIIEAITIIPEEIYSGASTKASQYNVSVESAIDSITVTDSRYDILKNIHDYICNNAWYNLVAEQRVHSSEAFFIGDGGVVCEGYAKTFKVICDRLEIPCVLVSGDAGGAHMWNYVQMDDGKWYLIDATWDDQESKIYDTYFLANSNTVGFDGVAISEERTERNDFSGTGVFSFIYPVLSDSDYVAVYVKNPLEFDDSAIVSGGAEKIWDGFGYCYNYDNFTFYIKDNENITIYDCDENAKGTVTIPSKLFGYNVRVGSDGDGYSQQIFEDCNNVTKIVVSEGIKYIGNGAFLGCTSVKEIVLPESVEHIFAYAFYGCVSLEKLNIPDNVKEIGPYAFNGSNIALTESNWKNGALYWDNCLIDVDENLEGTLVVENGTKNIASGAFDWTEKLSEVVLPEGLKYISGGISEQPSEIERINIPESVTYIGSGFLSNAHLEYIDVHDNNEYYCDVDGSLLTKNKEFYIRNASGRKYNAVYNIPDGVKTIKGGAFKYSNYGEIIIPASVVNLVGGCFSFSYIRKITLPKTIENISGSIFYYCKKLEEVNILCSIKSIPSGMFMDCDKLKSITIPEGVEKIGGKAFQNCKSLTEVTLPATLKEIKSLNYAANGCVFEGCSNLKNITVDINNKYFTAQNGILYDKAMLRLIRCPEAYSVENVVIPSTVKKIYAGAFKNCINIESVELPDGIEYISDYLFENCINLKKINLPSSVRTIEFAAFRGCSSLDITIPKTVIKIRSDALDVNIKGYTGSVAETYAKENELEFESVGTVDNDYSTDLNLDISNQLKWLPCENFMDGNIIFLLDSLEKIYVEELIYSSSYMMYDPNWLPIDDEQYIGTGAKFLLIPSGEGVYIDYFFVRMGDVNGDGVINEDDIKIAKKYIGRKVCKNEYSAMAADIDGDRKITNSDIEGLIKVVNEETTMEQICNVPESSVNDEKHIFVTLDYVAPTCIKTGLTEGYMCTSCNIVTVPQKIIGKVAHEYSNVCDKDCNVCGEIRTVPEHIGGTATCAKKAICTSCGEPYGEFLDHVNVDSDQYCDICDMYVVAITEYGSCGDNLAYSIHEDGTLVIRGDGEMLDSDQNNPSPFSGSDIKSVVIKDGVTTIGKECFKNCSSLESIEIPATVKSIGYGAFYNCSSLKNIVLPNGITTIEGNAFEDCSNLQNVTIPDSVTSIKSWAFLRCTSLKSVVIPNKLTVIEDYVFFSCSNLENIVIPDSITVIKSAFQNCWSIKNIYYGGTEEQWNNIQINTDNSLLSRADKIYNHNAPHPMGEWVSSDNGTHIRYCQNEYPCSYTETENCIYSEWKVLKAPTCLETGLKETTCTVCGYVLTEEIAKLPHTLGTTVTENRIEPKCEVKGSYNEVVYCSVCGIELSRTEKEIPALGHNIIDWNIEIEPICTMSGKEVAVCSMCDNPVEQNILCAPSSYPESDHNYGNGLNEEYDFSFESAEKLTIKFSVDTEVENNYDFIYIYDSAGEEYGKYSGRELAGKVIEIEGNSFKIKITSDGSVNKYGFKIDSIYAYIHNPEYEREISSLGHDMSNWSKNDNGIHSRNCKRTGCTYTETADCTYTEWNITKSATCTETGSKSKTCTVCGYVVTEVIDKLPHTEAEAIVENRVEPKCEVKGSYDEVVYCSVCDTELARIEKEIAALEHNWDNGVINPVSTCKTHGTKIYTCQNDTSHTKTDKVALDSNNHEGGTYLKDESKATCTANGYTGDTYCSGCNVKLSSGEVIDSLGHDMSNWSKNDNGIHSRICKRTGCTYTETADCTYTEWNITKSATCTETGSKSKTCTLCGYVVTESIEKLPHAPDSVVTENRVEPKCEVKGSYDEVVYCSVCDTELSRIEKEIAALEHNWDNGVINPVSTCKTHGTKIYTCQNDTSHTKTDKVALDSNNHEGGTYLKDESKATCTANGCTGDTYCSGCNVKLSSGEVIDSLGHDMSNWAKSNNGKHSRSCIRTDCAYTETADCTYTEWNITKSATCTETGSKSKTCTLCGYVVTESIGKLPHTPDSVVTENRVEPKCEVKGSYDEVVYCSVCDIELSRIEKEIAALEHNWDNGVINPVSTCKTHGTKTYTCQNDTTHAKTDKVALDANNHEGGTYLKNESKATCTVNGYTGDIYCSSCNLKLSTGEIVIATNHSNAEIVEQLDATCTSVGYTAGLYCLDCEQWIEGHKEIPIADHTDSNLNKFCDLCDQYLVELLEFGFCGDNIAYSLHTDGTLVIRGEGEMFDFEWDNPSPFSRNDIKYVVIKGPVTTVGKEIFRNCSSLEGIVIPCCVTSIRNGAFWGCSSLKNILIPEGVTVIETYAFYLCNSLENITIPDSLTSIGYGAFWGCSSLKNMWLPEGLTSIESYTFCNCGSLENIIIPDTVRSIGSSAFKGCSSIKNIEIPDGVTTIKMAAFNNCRSLENITIPVTVKSIEDDAFWDCLSLKNIFYTGSEGQWNGIAIGDYNYELTNYATIYYYHSKPHEMGKETTLNDGTHIRYCQNEYPCSYTETEICTLGEWVINKNASCSETGSKSKSCTVCGYVVTEAIEKLPHTEAEPIVENRVEPKCEVKGSYDEVVYCSVCDTELSRTEKEIPALAHSWNKGIINPVSTCKTHGTKTYTCQNDASHKKTEQVALNPNNHEGSTYLKDKVDANCTEDGYTGDTYCSGCNVKLSSGEDIDSLGHDMSNWSKNDNGTHSRNCKRTGCTYTETADCTYTEWNITKSASCTETGSKSKACTVCGYIVTEAIGKLPHIPATAVTENRVEPKCEIKGSYDEVVYCSVCNTELSRTEKEIPALSHNWNDGVINPASTCKTHGTKTYTCQNDASHTKTERVALDSNNHEGGTYLKDKADATCTEDGYTGDTYCSGCNVKLSSGEVINATNHANTEHSLKVDATCSSIGYTEGIWCNDCNEWINGHEEIAILSHIPATAVIENRIEPKCEVKGSYDEVVYCSVCDTELSRTKKEIPALTHNWNSGVINPVSTCKTHGTKTYTCQNDTSHTKTEQVALDSSNHEGGTYLKDKADATCTSNGYTGDTYCSGCNVKLSTGEIIPATNHPNGEFTEQLDATCTSVGYTAGTYCPDCKEWIDGHEEISIFAHTPDLAVTENRVEAKCEVKGSYDEVVYCLVCDTELSRTKKDIPALEHTTVTDEAVAPDCVNTGLTEGKHCSVCNKILIAQNIIPANGHKHTSVVTAPTCTAKGYTTHTCTVCGNGYSNAFVNAKGHRYSSQIIKSATCTVAGTKKNVCSCGYSYTETIKALGHSYSSVYTVDKAANYKEAGSKSKHCTRKGCTAKTSVTAISRLTLAKVSGVKATPSTTLIKFTWNKVSGAEKYEVYYSTNGKKWNKVISSKNSVTVKKLKKVTTYKVKIKAVAGANNGAFSSVFTTSTAPAKVTMTDLRSKKAKILTPVWKKVSGASGYEVQYSTSKNFTEKTTKSKKFNSKITKYTFNKLKSKKKYYVRIRAYKTVNKKPVYGAWSTVKSIKVK